MRRHRLILAIALVVIAACGAAPEDGTGGIDEAGRIAELEQQIAQQERECEAIRAERDAARPSTGLPEAIQEGEPRVYDPKMSPPPPDRGPGPCRIKRWAIVRAQTGSSCDTYQAEISSWAEWCVAECDPLGVAQMAVEEAAARCSTFCSKKGCGVRVTLIPPPECGAYQCFEYPEECPDAECPLAEYCSLIDANEVWNCFCRDLIPT